MSYNFIMFKLLHVQSTSISFSNNSRNFPQTFFLSICLIATICWFTLLYPLYTLPYYPFPIIYSNIYSSIILTINYLY